MSSYKQNKQIYSTYSAYYQQRILHKMNRKSVLIEMLKYVLSFSIPLLLLLDRCSTKHEQKSSGAIMWSCYKLCCFYLRFKMVIFSADIKCVLNPNETHWLSYSDPNGQGCRYTRLVVFTEPIVSGYTQVRTPIRGTPFSSPHPLYPLYLSTLWLLTDLISKIHDFL